MKIISIIFKKLSNSDVKGINGSFSTKNGGGQTYIDFSKSKVKNFINSFFYSNEKEEKWNFKIKSLYYKVEQDAEISKRNDTTYCLRNQSNPEGRLKVFDLNFPVSEQYSDNNPITFYIVKVENNLEFEYWAGWFDSSNTIYLKAGTGLEKILIESCGYIDLHNSNIELDINELHWPFCFEEIKHKLSTKINNLPLQQIYYGAPGTGKSHTIDGIVNEDNSIRTTFHPDSDYATFVGAYKPTMENVKMSTILGEEVGYVKAKEGHPGTEQKIVYKYIPQAFLKAYVNAWKKYNPLEDVPYYLVIEEINRGNCAQIFGDLFQLLDRNNQGASSYSIDADDDIRKFLFEDEKGFAKIPEEQKNIIKAFQLIKDNGRKEEIGEKILEGTKLLLPPNLRIWATMNTSDQSLFPIDSAFKRRWDWKYIPIDYKPKDKNGNPLNWQFKIKDGVYSWGEFLELINPIINTITESSDKQMGYFFAKAGNKGVISEETFLNKVLFYLWTDVFKDYDISAYEIFKNNKENRSFRFTDFFDDNEALGNFIKNLKLNEQDKDKVENQENKDSE